MQENNEQAFSCLIDRYNDVLFRHICRRTQSEDDAAEILQDIYLSLWNKRFSVYAEDTLYPYLFKAAKYEVINFLLKKERDILKQQMLLLQEEAYDFPMEDVMIARELEELLAVEIAKMPATMKEIFQMSRYQSLSAKEIAELLSVSEQTVKNNISIALKRLRFTLKREHYLTVAAAVLSALH